MALISSQSFGRLALALLGLATSAPSIADKTTPAPVVVSVKLVHAPSGGHTLAIVLRNAGDKAIHVLASHLPWTFSAYGIQLKATESDAAGRELQQVRGVESGEATVELAGRKQLTGSIPLRAAFPELDSILGKNDVIVHWTYRFTQIDPKSLEIVGKPKDFSGTLKIAKRTR